MRKGTIATITVLTMATLASATTAGTEVDISGQVRARAELDQKSFDTADGMRQYTYLRTRVKADATISENTHAVVQFQDSRRLGDNDYSATLNDGMNVDIHQAYLKVDQLWENGPGVKVGRFEVNLGNQRVFGGVGWHNVGRSWEGVEAFFDRPKVKFNAYWLKRLERDSQVGNADFDVYGLHATMKDQHLDLFGFLESDALLAELDQGGETYTADHQNMKRFTFGFYTKQTHEQFDFEFNGALQTGKQRYWPDTDTLSAEGDLSGMMFTGEAGYSFDSPRNPRVAVGIDYASGDDDLTDNDYKAYNNLYYTGHKFRGFMDYFIGSNEAGLMDLMLRGSCHPVEGWTVKADLHLFSTAADYEYIASGTSDTTMTTDVGTEIDLTVSTGRIAGVKLAAGGGVFMPTEAWSEMNDPETGLWGWLQLTADF